MNKLRFRKDGTFKIVQFTDLHWQNGEQADLDSQALMYEILDCENPDFVVFTGDIIHSELSKDPKTAFINAVSVVSNRNIPWAFVFGNHDAEEGITREEIMAVSKELPFCYVEQGTTQGGGVGNYNIMIHSAVNPTSFAAVLYMFDSGSYAPRDIGGAAWIKQDQIKWYIHASTQLEEQNIGGKIPSLAFFHIPLPEFNELWDFHTCFGNNYEGVGSPKINSGLFHAFLERGDVKGIFVGHDHVNDYWGDLYGIRLCYGRATGFNTYGKDGFARGARVVRMFEDNQYFETWLRLEGGTIIKDQLPHLPVLHDLSIQFKKRMRL